MSSIYDALKRIQEGDYKEPSPVIEQGFFTRARILWIVLFAAVLSSVCTAAAIYGLRTVGSTDAETARTINESPAAKIPDVNDFIANKSVLPVKSDTIDAKDAVTKKPSITEQAAVAEKLTVTEQPVKKDISTEVPYINDLAANAKSLSAKGNIKEAIELYVNILTIAPDYVDAYIDLGGLYYKAQEYEKALLNYTKAKRYLKDDAMLLNNIGSVMLAKGEPDKALQFFIRSQKVSEGYIEPIYNLACAYARMGNSKAAITTLKDACSRQPQVMNWAVQDPDFACLRGYPEFDAMVETIVRRAK